MSSVENYVPYQPNAQGLTEALLDTKSTMPTSTVFKVTGYITTCFENVTQGDAVYSRQSDGFVGKAIANNIYDQATVAGFVETTKPAGSEVSVITKGLIATSGLDAGDFYFLSAASTGSITNLPPEDAGNFVTKIGEAASSSQLIVDIQRPIKLS